MLRVKSGSYRVVLSKIILTKMEVIIPAQSPTIVCRETSRNVLLDDVVIVQDDR